MLLARIVGTVVSTRKTPPLEGKNSLTENPTTPRLREGCNILLGPAIGKVVPPMKNDPLVGQRLLIVQPIDRHGRDKGKAIVALDSGGAGGGGTVSWGGGKEARFS